MKCAQGGIHSQTSRRPGPPSGRTGRGSPPLSAPQGGHHQGAAGRAVGRPPPLLSPRLGAQLGPRYPGALLLSPPGSVRASRCSRSLQPWQRGPRHAPWGAAGDAGEMAAAAPWGDGGSPAANPSLRTGPGLWRGEMEGVGHFLCGQGNESPVWGDSRGANRRAVATARTGVSAPCRKTLSPATSHSYFRDKRHSCVVPGSGRTLVKKLFQYKYNYIFQYIWNYIHTPCNSMPHSCYKVSQTTDYEHRPASHKKGRNSPLLLVSVFWPLDWTWTHGRRGPEVIL